MALIRATHILDDIQQSIIALLTQLTTTTSPWTDWKVVTGFPEEAVFEQFAKPIIFVLEPIIVGKLQHQGQNAINRRYRMTIGAWLDRKHGGTEELNIIGSRLMSLFDDPRSACVTTTFNITLGTTTYTATNLTTLGIYTDGIEGPMPFYILDEKEFRHDYNVYVVA